LLYNFEKLSGFKFGKNLVEKLAKDFAQIIGIKDSTANLYKELKIPNFKVFVGTEVRLLENLKIGGAGLISATVNVTLPIAKKVYSDFNNNVSSNLNDNLVSVRKVFDQFNLISALHSFKAQEDKSYKNILPPLKLLNKNDENKLLQALDKIKFRRAA